MLLDKHIIMSERFANSDESNNFEISDELLYNLAWGIFGIDDNTFDRQNTQGPDNRATKQLNLLRYNRKNKKAKH